MGAKYLIKLIFVLHVVIAISNSNVLNINDRQLTKLVFNDTMKMGKNYHLIDASGNEITEIDEKLFMNYKSLRILDLTMNNDYDFPKNRQFLKSETIQFFYCNECGLTEIYCETFIGLRNIKELHLNKNKILIICVASFQENKHLESLYLDGNKLKNFNEQLFVHLPVFMHLSVNNNSDFNFNDNELVSQSLTDFTCNFCGFEKIIDKTFHKSINLRKISLNNNKITYISPDSFRSNVKLTDIELGNNSLKTFPHEILNDLNVLEKLCLDFNPFESSLENNILKAKYKSYNCSSNSPEGLNNLLEFYLTTTTTIATTISDVITSSEGETESYMHFNTTDTTNIMDTTNTTDIVNTEESTAKNFTRDDITKTTNELTPDNNQTTTDKPKIQRAEISISHVIIYTIAAITIQLIVVCILWYKYRNLQILDDDSDGEDLSNTILNNNDIYKID